MAPRFHSLEVAKMHRETPDAVTISFAVPQELKSAFRFDPGQYLTLRADVDGVDTRRSYSICSGLDDGSLRVAVKKVTGGSFSQFANTDLKPGMLLEVMPPEGRFVVRPDEEARNNFVAFAAGSGVTPILSIVKSILTREANSTIALFYGNRDAASVIFREELDDLKDRFLGRFTLTHILSGEGRDVDLFHGRLDEEKITALAKAGLFSVEETDRFLVCGPGTMIEQTREALSGLGVAEQKVSFERFVPDGETRAARLIPPQSAQAQKFAAEGAQIEVIVDGGRHRFAMNGMDENVVDAAHRSGLELPYSCKGGMCSTCRCRLVEGEAEMAQNYALEPWELEAGFVLACQSRPRTSRLVLDFDEV